MSGDRHRCQYRNQVFSVCLLDACRHGASGKQFWGGFSVSPLRPRVGARLCRLALLRVLRLAIFLLPVRLVFDFIVGQRASGSSRTDHPAVEAPLRRRANNANAVLIESLAPTTPEFRSL